MHNPELLFSTTTQPPAAQKPFIYRFSPIVGNGMMASYYDEGLAAHLPPASPNVIFVIEKVADGKASGYFIVGMIAQGLKPVKKRMPWSRLSQLVFQEN